jgi:hypothetical protein
MCQLPMPTLAIETRHLILGNCFVPIFIVKFLKKKYVQYFQKSFIKIFLVLKHFFSFKAFF